MRFILLAALLTGALARADEPRPPTWYASWPLIVGGGATTLVGTALAMQDGSSRATHDAGWSLLGVGTAVWIGGSVMLRLSETRHRPPGRAR